jgi:DnaJ-class molecular chaperone
MIKNYYAEDVVIRATFKLLAHRHHPDKCLEDPKIANQLMAQINESYNTLSDAALKAAYDNKRGSYTADTNFYRTLGVLDNVDTLMINAAYKALVKKYQQLPNLALSEERLFKIHQAHQTLADPARRKAYDIQQRASSYLFRSNQGSGLSLWKVYLLYNVIFYILITIIYLLI